MICKKGKERLLKLTQRIDFVCLLMPDGFGLFPTKHAGCVCSGFHIHSQSVKLPLSKVHVFFFFFFFIGTWNNKKHNFFLNTVSHLPWIIHRPCCQQFPSELLSTGNTDLLKMVGSLLCGLSSQAEIQFLEKYILFNFLLGYFYFISKQHRQKFHLLPLSLGKDRNTREETGSLW